MCGGERVRCVEGNGLGVWRRKRGGRCVKEKGGVEVCEGERGG